MHGTTEAVPAVRLAEERAVMLPAPALKAAPSLPQRVALPVESLQHPLAVYDELLEVTSHEPAARTHRRAVRAAEVRPRAHRMAGAGAGRCKAHEASFADFLEKVLACELDGAQRTPLQTSC